MRLPLISAFLLLLAACSGDPRAYGITGPGSSKPIGPPSIDGADTEPAAGVTTTGTSYGPTNRPTTGSSGFWGYN